MNDETKTQEASAETPEEQLPVLTGSAVSIKLDAFWDGEVAWMKGYACFGDFVHPVERQRLTDAFGKMVSEFNAFKR